MNTPARWLLVLSTATALLAVLIAKTNPLTWSGLMLPVSRVLLGGKEPQQMQEPGLGLKMFYDGENAMLEYSTEFNTIQIEGMLIIHLVLSLFMA
jgi:hypothetical protein